MGHQATLASPQQEIEQRIRERVGQAFEGMMHALYRQEGAMLDIQVIQEPEVTDFIGTHADALNSSMQQVAMSDAMRHRLERSNFIFSGFKTFHELNEAFPSLIDENGERKPFERFLKDVLAIDETYNRNYLRAEYNFCQASADMAAKWEQIEADGDRYNLQYRTQHDDKVRPEHAALDGVTLPPSDPFWESYYPPNGWNCRCTVAQVRKSKYPTTDPEEARARGEEALQKDTRGIFRFNSGKEGKTFPDYNPYTISRCRDCDIAQGKANLAFIPSNTLCAACPIINKCYNDLSKTENAVLRKHYLREMAPLLAKKVTVNGNGHLMKVGFNTYGNKHLYSDTFWRATGLRKEDLSSLDQLLSTATFVSKASLSKPRKDDIKRFYYFKAILNGRTVYLNVAETDFVRPNGKYFHDRFLYSVTDSVKK